MTDIRVVCTAIPDGRRSDGKFRVSILLTPTLERTSPTFDLDHWPNQINEGKAGTLWVAVTDDRGQSEKIAFSPAAFNNWPNPRRDKLVDRSGALWRQIFRDYSTKDEKYRFEALSKIFGAKEAAAPGMLKFGHRTIDPAGLRFTGTYALTKSITRYKELLIATRYLYGSALARILEARRNNPALTEPLRELAATQPVAALLNRRFIDPLLASRLQAAEWFGFSDLRLDAIGRLAGIADKRAGSNRDRPAGSFGGYVENAKKSFKEFFDEPKAGGTKLSDEGKSRDGDPPGVEQVAQWLDVEFEGNMQPGSDLKLRAEDSLQAALVNLFRSQLVAQQLAHPIEPLPSKRAPEPNKNQEDDDVRRKFAGVRSIPTLAKFLGFIIDVELPKNAQPAYIAAGFFPSSERDPNIDKLDRTACDFDEHLFCAASKEYDDKQADYVIENGLLKFKTDPVKESLYSIQSVDGTLLLQSFAHDSANLLDAINNGAMADTLNAKLPETSMRGLQIIHSDAQRQTVGSLKRAQANGAKPAAASQTYYAENLLIGFRLDVRRTRSKPRPDNTQGSMDWASLTAREVAIGELKDLFKSGHLYPDCLERDFGVLRRLQKQVPSGSEHLVPVASQVLATWMGDHLGVPTPQFDLGEGKSEARVRPSDPQADLGLSIDFDFSKRLEDIAPVLRIGDGYEFGLRAVMPNGASLSLADAKKLYNASGEKFVLGGGAGPYYYRQYGDIRPPQMLLPPDDPLVRPAVASDAPNERDDRVVLRSRSSTGRQTIRRFLVPGRVSFEEAEQFRLFDHQLEQRTPLGAFRQFRRNRDTGAFPAARYGSIDEQAQAGHPVTGAVLVPLAAPVLHEPAPYFPDPLGRNLKVMFERNLAVPDGYEEQSPPRAFWGSEASPLAATPILLELRTNDDLGSGGRFVAEETSAIIAGFKFPKLAIEIAPGETVTLWYWALPDPEDEIRLCGHSLGALTAFNAWQVSRELVPGARGGVEPADISKYLEGIRSGTKPSKSEAAEKTVSQWMKDADVLPSFDTKGWGKIDLVYAVQKPLSVPLFRIRNGMPAFNAVRVAPERKWDEDLIGGRVPYEVPSDAGGTTIYLTGLMEFDRRSTVELTGDFAAEDYSDARSVIRDGDKWRFKPAIRQDQLFQIKAIPIDHGANAAGTLDLARDETGALRGLSYDFGTIIGQNPTAAHEISVRLVARSRFEREFNRDTNDDHQFLQESRKPFVKKNQVTSVTEKGPAGEQSGDHEFRFWIPSTERPPKPIVERLSWISPEKVSRTGSKIVVERWCCPRIYLSRPWFVSGADELLAVICAPSDLVDDRPYTRQGEATSLTEPWDLLPGEKSRADELRRLKLDEFEKPKSLALLADYVTRWGADATTDGGTLEPVIAPERFRGFVATIHNVPLPIPKLEKPALRASNRRLGIRSTVASLPTVSAFLYRPQFDEETGSWYVDLGFDPGAAHMPFLQLSLARYQPHSLDGLSLSEPVVIDPIQIPAKRTVDIDLVDERRVIARVQGIGYVRRAPFNTEGPPPEPWRELTDTPLQNVQLMRRDGSATGPVVAFDVRGNRIERLRVQPIANGPDLTWICPFDLPTPRTAAGQYYVQFDEIELHIPDEDLQVARTPDKPDYFVEKPSMFSCRVPL